MKENSKVKAGDFIKQFGFNKEIADKYPDGLFYYSLNTQFIKLKKTTREHLIKSYQIIISNSNFRELIFHGVYCVLTPKEYFLVKYLLENGSFHNKNFTQIGLMYEKMICSKVKKKCKFIKTSKKLKASIFYIANLEDGEIKRMLNYVKHNPKNVIIKAKKQKQRIEFSADSKSEISNYKNKIKAKLKECMEQKNILLEEFEYKFDCFMRTKYYNYEFEYPKISYQTLITSYKYKIAPKRVSKQC